MTCASGATFRNTKRDTSGLDFIELSGEFVQHQQYGLDARRWRCADRAGRLLQGPPALRAKQTADFAHIIERVTAIGDPFCARLSAAADYGDAFGGGRAQLSPRGVADWSSTPRGRVATALAPFIRSSIWIIAWAFFHDAKHWENHLSETFHHGLDERGELMGHISIGLELVNSLWRKCIGGRGFMGTTAARLRRCAPTPAAG
jgi:3'-5' exoribonuclease